MTPCHAGCYEGVLGLYRECAGAPLQIVRCTSCDGTGYAAPLPVQAIKADVPHVQDGSPCWCAAPMVAR